MNKASIGGAAIRKVKIGSGEGGGGGIKEGRQGVKGISAIGCSSLKLSSEPTTADKPCNLCE